MKIDMKLLETKIYMFFLNEANDFNLMKEENEKYTPDLFISSFTPFLALSSTS